MSEEFMPVVLLSFHKIVSFTVQPILHFPQEFYKENENHSKQKILAAY